MRWCEEFKGLIFDLEVTLPRAEQSPRILMVGALRTDTGSDFEAKITIRDLIPKLQQLDALSNGACYIVGHNILEHDLPILRDQAPNLALHALPVIDTLRLSPLAFPQNPHHHLIKNYKLIRDSLNSPLADCRSTATLFNDQCQAFSLLYQTSPGELQCLQALLAPSVNSDLHAFFYKLTSQEPLPLTEVSTLIPTLLRETDQSLGRGLKVCQTRLEQLLRVDLFDTTQHWALAYVLAWLRVSGNNSVIAPWVRHQFPDVGRLVTELRDIPCGREECQYCRTTHDPHHELKRYFGYNQFRSEPDGRTLQHDVVLAGMRGEHVLAILATGGGKSLCYQLPALNRFHRNGSLTIIKIGRAHV